MNKEKLIYELEKLKERLISEVQPSYDIKGIEFGNNRYDALKNKTIHILDEFIPNESEVFIKKIKISALAMRNTLESNAQYFMRTKGRKYLAYIESLTHDIENDEYFPPKEEIKVTQSFNVSEKNRLKVFIVHGHNGETRERTARFIEKLGLQAIILHEQSNKGKTIIEKLEYYTDVGFAIVLYDEDDSGNSKIEAEKGYLNPRARQNVVFEHGLLIGRLGRDKVIPLVSGNPEMPSDVHGIVYIGSKNWQLDIAREIKEAGYEIDLNNAL